MSTVEEAEKAVELFHRFVRFQTSFSPIGYIRYLTNICLMGDSDFTA